MDGLNKHMNKHLALAISFIFITSIVGCSIPLTKAQSIGDIVINPNGSVTGTKSIQQDGNTYSFTANLTGTIQVQTSNIVINGKGFSLNQGQVDFSNEWGAPAINNVTIENMFIINGSIIAEGSNNTFYNDYISNSLGLPSIQLYGSSFNNISYCTLDSLNNEGAIMVTGGETGNLITQNNIIGGIYQNSILETVDKNYWSDYQTKYPNATEIDHSGIGNTPYVYYLHQNNQTPPWQDNHPLMKPVAIPLTGGSTASNIPELSWLGIMPLIVAILSIALILRHRKKINLIQ